MNDVVTNIIGITMMALGEKYLGLPTAMGRSTEETFEHIYGKIRGLLNGWGEKLLSCAAKETLIKAVTVAIPTYSLICFILSPMICKKIVLTISNYWWSSKLDKEAYTSEVGWNWQGPKTSRGIRFRDLRLFDQAMLGKHRWRLRASPRVFLNFTL
jgi:hypothetical protein